MEQHLTASRIVYSRGDAVARGLAERLVAVAGTGSSLRAAALEPAEFAAALRDRTERAYVLAAPRASLAPCHDASAWPAGTSVQPLIDTRASAIVRRGSPALTVDWDGTVRVAAMSFRTRLFLAIVVAVLLPLGALALGVRREMERRLTAEYEGRVAAMASVLEANLARESAMVAARLGALRKDLSQDNRFRLAALQNQPGARAYLLDYAGDAMRLSGLSLLQLQDGAGRILSSGHFRNEFDQLQPELPRLLATAPGTLTLVRTRTAEAPLLALARIDSLRVGGRRFTLVGGVEAEDRLLGLPALDRDLGIALAYPGAEPVGPSRARVVRELPLPYIDLLRGPGTALDTARFVVTQSLATLDALRRSVDRWFLLALGLTLGLAVIVAAWLSTRVSRPIRELARKTEAIDLDRLDQSFESNRGDEIGALSRLLGAMTERLRTSSVRLREAERRAAVGDLARQVNHDIKNGLAPIRNVLRHLSQVVGQDPATLPRVFEDRRSTLESSVEYLETLARNYARLSPAVERQPCDVNAIVSEVLRNTASDGTGLRLNLGEQLPTRHG